MLNMAISFHKLVEMGRLCSGQLRLRIGGSMSDLRPQILAIEIFLNGIVTQLSLCIDRQKPLGRLGCRHDHSKGLSRKQVRSSQAKSRQPNVIRDRQAFILPTESTIGNSVPVLCCQPVCLPHPREDTPLQHKPIPLPAALSPGSPHNGIGLVLFESTWWRPSIRSQSVRDE